MRILEIILLIIAAFSLLSFFKKQKINSKIVVILIVVSFLLHSFVEGLRWQMMTIYLVLAIFLTLFLLKKTSLRNKLTRISILVFCVLFLGLGLFLSITFPVFKLPKPTGEYNVGSQYLLMKTEREEDVTAFKNDKRELMIKVWYPANTKIISKEVYLNEAERVGFTKKYGLPKAALNYLDYVNTHTFKNAEIADGTFPVLIFSHGHYSQASGYYSLIEEIVSKGYIVFNVNHTYESMGSLFPKGEMKFYDMSYDRKYISTKEMASLAWGASQDFKKATNEIEKQKVAENILKNYVGAQINTRWAKDINGIINKLSYYNTSSFLADHIDISNIGVIGHSQGGSAAGVVALENNNVKAGVNLDGTQWGNMINSSIKTPFLYLSSDWNDAHPNFNKYAYKNSESENFYSAKIKNSGHSNFMDIPFLVNLKAINEAGSIHHTKAIKITTDLVVAFFDNYLKNKDFNLNKLSEKYPELELQNH